MIGHIESGQYLKNIARAILKKYCPPHKARGIHDFILATKSSVWIIIRYTLLLHHFDWLTNMISVKCSGEIFYKEMNFV